MSRVNTNRFAGSVSVRLDRMVLAMSGVVATPLLESNMRLCDFCQKVRYVGYADEGQEA